MNIVIIRIKEIIKTYRKITSKSLNFRSPHTQGTRVLFTPHELTAVPGGRVALTWRDMLNDSVSLFGRNSSRSHWSTKPYYPKLFYIEISRHIRNKIMMMMN